MLFKIKMGLLEVKIVVVGVKTGLEKLLATKTVIMT